MEVQSQQYDASGDQLEWQKNIHQQLINIMSMERLAREGCGSIVEYVEIPLNMMQIIIPDVQYKNFRFFALELSMLIDNLSPLLKDKTEMYIKAMQPILDKIDNRELFLREVKAKNQLAYIIPLEFMKKSVDLLVKIKSEIIKDIAPLLYLEEDNKKGWK